MNAQLPKLKFDANGLIPAIIQDRKTGQVLMMAWMNADALSRTIATKQTHFFSRSRNKLWLKGERSGHVQHVKWMRVDCDADVLLIGVGSGGSGLSRGILQLFLPPGGAGGPECGREKIFDPDKVYV